MKLLIDLLRESVGNYVSFYGLSRLLDSNDDFETIQNFYSSDPKSLKYLYKFENIDKFSDEIEYYDNQMSDDYTNDTNVTSEITAVYNKLKNKKPTMPVFIDKEHGVVVSGGERLIAYDWMGETNIPCVYIER